jgi:hypothetical protein
MLVPTDADLSTKRAAERELPQADIHGFRFRGEVELAHKPWRVLPAHFVVEKLRPQDACLF